MRIVRLDRAPDPIEAFASVAAFALEVGDGEGEAHVYCVTFEAGGSIGPHEAGFGQLFVPLRGAGWIAGEDGVRADLAVGTAGYVRRGETHSKGSDTGMTALMVQVRDLDVS